MLDLSNNKIFVLNMMGFDKVIYFNLILNEFFGLLKMCNVNNELLVLKLMYLWFVINYILDLLEFCC